MKKLLSGLLAVCLVLTLLPLGMVTARAVEPSELPTTTTQEFTIGEKTYTLGFGNERDAVDGLVNMGGNSTVSYEKETSGNYGDAYYSLPFAIFLVEYKGMDGFYEIYYQTDASREVTWTIQSIKLSYILGDKNDQGEQVTFSLEKGSLVPSKTNVASNVHGSYAFDVYYNRQYAGYSLITAEVYVEATETTYTVTGIAGCDAIEPVKIDCETENIVTAAALNDRLADIHTNQPVEIHLANANYTDTTVNIPSMTTGFFPDAVAIFGASYPGSSVVESMCLNGNSGYMIENVDFIADGSEVGLNGTVGAGSVGLMNCSFRGYQIAVNSTNSFIAATRGNVFQDNEIAAWVNIGPDCGTRQDNWTYNTFKNNNIAVKITQLNNTFPPTLFRLEDDNFINNEVDFDISMPGHYFMYCNFYSQDGSVCRAPRTTEGTGVFIHCYPAQNSVRDFGPFSQAGALILGDGEDANVILNSMASSLGLYVEQLPNKTIQVVEMVEGSLKEVATWRFENGRWTELLSVAAGMVLLEDSPGETEQSGPTFYAGLDINENAEGSITVEIPKSNDAVLEQIKATLSIPCMFGAATVTGPDGEQLDAKAVLCDGETVSFPVTVGGVYTIALPAFVKRGVLNSGTDSLTWGLTDEGQLVISGNFPTGSRVIVAEYGEKDRMLAATVLDGPGGVTVSGGGYAKVFWVDSGFIPKCECATTKDLGD